MHGGADFGHITEDVFSKVDWHTGHEKIYEFKSPVVHALS